MKLHSRVGLLLYAARINRGACLRGRAITAQKNGRCLQVRAFNFRSFISPAYKYQYQSIIFSKINGEKMLEEKM